MISLCITVLFLGLTQIQGAAITEDHSLVPLRDSIRQLSDHHRIYYQSQDTSLVKSLGAPKQSTGCLICEYVLGEVVSLLDSEKSQKTIFPWIEKKICGKLYKPSKNIIHKLINSYCEKIMGLIIKEVTKLIDNNVKPVTVCTNLKLCTSTTGKSLYVKDF